MSTGLVFDIQHYSIHDGPGVRTDVFLKGCPLKCKWCQNPESQSFKPQVMFNADKCTGCGKCAESCTKGAISFDKNHISVTDRSLCVGCYDCVENCIPKARSKAGEIMTPEEVYKEVAKDAFFYGDDGGVTVSGGEALSQHEFLIDLLKLCKDNGIGTCIETTGFAEWERIEAVMPYVDIVLHDIKHMDSEMHQTGTGVGNELILENLKKLSNELKKPIVVRTPIMPGFNSSDENITAMAEFIRDNLPSCIEVNLLPYHNLGEGKKTQLDRDDAFLCSVPEPELMEHLRDIIRDITGLVVK